MGRCHWTSRGHLPRKELWGAREAEITHTSLPAKLIQSSLFQEQDKAKEVSPLKLCPQCLSASLPPVAGFWIQDQIHFNSISFKAGSTDHGRGNRMITPRHNGTLKSRVDDSIMCSPRPPPLLPHPQHSSHEDSRAPQIPYRDNSAC